MTVELGGIFGGARAKSMANVPWGAGTRCGSCRPRPCPAPQGPRQPPVRAVWPDRGCRCSQYIGRIIQRICYHKTCSILPLNNVHKKLQSRRNNYRVTFFNFTDLARAKKCFKAMAEHCTWSLVLRMWIIAAALMFCLRVEANPYGGAVKAGARMSVRVVNELKVALVVHCWPRRGDVGTRTLRPGEFFYWTFKTNWNGSNLYWCRFEQTASPIEIWNQFEVWNGPGFFGTQSMACEQCLWVARTDGFYRAEEPGINTLVYVKSWIHGE